MKSMRNWLGLALSIIGISSNIAWAQNHNIQWANRAGGMDTDDVFGVSHDSNGNTYTTGGFQGTATFGTTTLTSAWSRDAHISKIDATGNYLWTLQGSGSNGSERGMAIATDDNGYSYVTGYFSTSVTFGTQTATANGYDNFIIKVDPNGNCVWATNYGGDNDEWAYDIALDNSGNVYITGYINGAGHFGTISTSATSGNDVFITKLDSNGNFLWAEVFGGTESEVGYGIDVDASGNVFVTGYFRGTATIAGQSINSTSANLNDIFVTKYNTSGVGQWASNYGGTNGNDYGRGIAADGNGDIYVTGYYSGTINFGANTVVSDTAMYSTSPSIDSYIAKFDGNGNNLWARTAGEARDDYALDVDVDGANNAFITGYTEGDMIFDFGLATEFRLYNTNDQSWSAYEDVFVAGYASNGDFIWAKGGGDGYSDRGNAISVDNSSNVYVGGHVYETGSASFSGMSPTGPVNTDVDDALILKYVPQTSVLYTKTDIDCHGNDNGAIDITPDFGTGPYSYSWTGPNGFTSTSEDISSLASGTYTVTVTDLPTSNTSTESVIVISPTPVVASPGNIWDASDCNTADGSAHVVGNGGTHIVGPAPYIYTWSASTTNSQLVDFLLPGEHTVIITDANGCSDTTSMIVGPTTDAGTLSGGSTICEDESTGTLTLSNTTGDIIKWQVSVDGGSWTDIANTTNTYSELLSTAGTYDYRAIAKCGDNVSDTSTVTTVIVETCADINKNEMDFITIYPNPSRGSFSIDGAYMENIEIFDLSGKVVFNKAINGNEALLDVNLSEGLYPIKISNGNEYTLLKLVIR